MEKLNHLRLRPLLVLIALLVSAALACNAAGDDNLLLGQSDPTATSARTPESGAETGTEETSAEEAPGDPPTPVPTAEFDASQPGPAADPGVVAALEGTLEQIYENVGPSVVHIQVVVESSGASPFPGFTPPQQGPQRGEGSGFVWDQQGHIVTNNHVVEGASSINVIFSDGLTVSGTLVGADADSDLAVLRVDDVPAEQLRPITLADSTQVRVGELAIAIGNPFGQEGSLTVGVISALGRLLPVQAATFGAPSYSIPDVIQTDAAINPGNSGGVLLDDQGRVIGVTTAIISPARSSSGVGFAVPSRIVANVVPSLIATGAYQHPYLGIRGTSLTPPLAEAMDLPATQRGALVIEVEAGGPSGEAGLQGSDQEVTVDGFQALVGGDVITALEGEAVRSMDDLITQLARNGQVGQTVTLTILRDGQEQQVDVLLRARPASTPPPALQEAGQAWVGIRASTLSLAVAEAMGLPATQTGVLVGEVVGDSPAEAAGLQGSDTPVQIDGQELLVGGDIIIALDNHPITDMGLLQQLLAQYAPGDEIVLTVLRNGEQLELPLTLGTLPN